jgi:GSH-dependent disulfide-bond oxidoreductase
MARAAKSKVKSKKKSARRASAKPRSRVQKPIELFFWPTPNGFKITTMLEEAGLPYVVRPVNISKGDQFKPAFLKISPNNRMPAIIDPNGPGGKSISVFESGAILQYLGRKTGKFYPKDERRRVEVDEWLHWQMGGLGPMAGQANHFRRYAPEKIEYGINRYTNEVRRLLGLLNKRLAKRKFVAGELSIADFAILGWARILKRMGQDPDEFPHLMRWIKRMEARPATKRGLAVRCEEYGAIDISKDKEAWNLLFNQGARN